MMADPIYRVHQVTQALRQLLEQSFAPLWVEGEVSNFRESPSGHWYLTLKDEYAQLPCVMWRNLVIRQGFRPSTGVQVRVFGTLTIYPHGGTYQIQATRILPVGQGAFLMAFEQLRDRLAAEGLFEPERKRPLPRFPKRIGIVTSPRGAAIRDMLDVLARRYPPVKVTLYPALVQGEEAPSQIIRALDVMNRLGIADVLIVGRGGGSIEDLWAFNDEGVVRAVAGSAIPVISAVGHEIDFTLCDFAADVRAPTPSAAAELAVPDRAALLRELSSLRQRAVEAMTNRLTLGRQEVRRCAVALSPRRRLEEIHHQAQRVDELGRRLEVAVASRVERARSHLATSASALNALSPLATLERGYGIIFDGLGKVVRDATMMRVGEAIRVRLRKGELDARVTGVRDDS
jgi:exodeoxyribonuclease VII large subunit